MCGRGRDPAVVGRQMAAVFWAVAACFMSAVWVGEVIGILNPADTFSRIRDVGGKKAVVTGATDGHPLNSRKTFKTKSDSAREQYSFDPTRSGFGGAYPCAEKPGREIPARAETSTFGPPLCAYLVHFGPPILVKPRPFGNLRHYITAMSGKAGRSGLRRWCFASTG